MLFLNENVNTSKTKAIAGMRADIEMINTTFDIIALKEEVIKSEVAYLSLSEEAKEEAKPAADEKKKNFIKSFFAKVREFFEKLIARFKLALAKIKSFILNKMNVVEIHVVAVDVLQEFGMAIIAAGRTIDKIMGSSDIGQVNDLLQPHVEKIDALKKRFHDGTAAGAKTKIYRISDIQPKIAALDSITKDLERTANNLKNVAVRIEKDSEMASGVTSAISKYMSIAGFSNTLATYLSSRLSHSKVEKSTK